MTKIDFKALGLVRNQDKDHGSVYAYVFADNPYAFVKKQSVNKHGSTQYRFDVEVHIPNRTWMNLYNTFHLDSADKGFYGVQMDLAKKLDSFRETLKGDMYKQANSPAGITPEMTEFAISYQIDWIKEEAYRLDKDCVQEAVWKKFGYAMTDTETGEIRAQAQARIRNESAYNELSWYQRKAIMQYAASSINCRFNGYCEHDTHDFTAERQVLEEYYFERLSDSDQVKLTSILDKALAEINEAQKKALAKVNELFGTDHEINIA